MKRSTNKMQIAENKNNLTLNLNTIENENKKWRISNKDPEIKNKWAHWLKCVLRRRFNDFKRSHKRGIIDGGDNPIIKN